LYENRKSSTLLLSVQLRGEVAVFNAKEKRIIGQVVFEAWTQSKVASALLDHPTEFLASRGIKDRHGRAFVAHMDTRNTMNLIVPWMPDAIRLDPDALPPEEKLGQVQGMLRVNWASKDVEALFKLLKKVWTDPSAAAELLDRPREVLAKYLDANARKKLADGRIAAREDSSSIVHFVIPTPPVGLEKILEDVSSGGYQPMCSASVCMCDGDDDGDGGGDGP
jgi:hypothetical protein